MGNGKNIAPGLGLVFGHPLPEVDVQRAAPGLHGDERKYLAGLIAVVPENYVAMDVIRPLGGPLVADKGREASGSLYSSAAAIVSCQVDCKLCLRRVDQRLGKGSFRKTRRRHQAPLLALSILHHFIPFAPLGIGDNVRLARSKVRKHSHVVRVIGNDEKIQRRDSLTGRPDEEVTCSPLAKR